MQGSTTDQLLPGYQDLSNWATDIATGGNVQSTTNSFGGNNYSPFNQATDVAGSNASGASNVSASEESLLGPFLSEAWNQVGVGKGLENATGGVVSMLDKAVESPTGLLPGQEAMINQATTAEQTGIASQLGAEGLASSTAMPILEGEAAQQGAATGGQLIQQNIQLALSGQQLGLQEQAQIEGQSQSLQQNMFTEAQQANSMLNTFINTGLSGYTLALNADDQIEAASANSATNATQLQNSQNAASASSLNTLGQGLGSILGGSGGSGGSGGLLGSLGSSLFGGGAMSAADEAAGAIAGEGITDAGAGAAAGGGLLSSIGGGISAAAGAVGSGASAAFAAAGALLAF